MTQRIALTGGIGSGKSTVAKMFAAMSVPVLDLDVVGRELLDSAKIRVALIEVFGLGIIDKLGYVDRRVLAERAFCDAEKIARLNAILHPEILKFEQQWLEKQSAPYAIIEASVLLESGGVARMDGLIVVLADQALRKARVLARGKQDEAMFEKIIARQCDDNLRRKHADYILHNDGSLESLQSQVMKLSKQFMEKFL